MVTPGSDRRHAQPLIAHHNLEIYRPYKFQDFIFHSFWENGWTNDYLKAENHLTEKKTLET
jgi:hypothetical protein